MQLQFLMYWPFIRHVTSAITPPFEKRKLYNIGMRESRSLAGIHRGQIVKNINELVYERLAFDTEEKMLEMIVRQVRRAVCITPQLHCRNVRIFFSHNMLDWDGERR